ncbi:hypothetical protein ACFT9M_06285 [Micromonospora purpureochromogenes]|uniref:hypothetical protein n=1 Tax=Micromonospora purpureochromogenes TaxID=47872 RepID=UPI00362DB287
MAVDGESDAIAYQWGGARSPQVTNPSTADHTFGGGGQGFANDGPASPGLGVAAESKSFHATTVGRPRLALRA